MADYIYLFQNRLTPAQRKALEAVRDVARAHGMPVFLAGGAARDLTSGTPVRDMDFAVQGDVRALLEELTSRGASIAGENPVLASTYLLFPGGIRMELGPTLTVSYPKPSQPETHPAAILDDLRRRDFTANAMAISLNEGSYGLLLDPLNGVADIENRELRLVSNYGFIEQPALLLRAARLSGRLGWTLEARTQGRYETAKEEDYLATLAERERNYELEEIFYEEDPLATLDHLAAEGWGGALYPAWTSAKADRDGLERVRDLMGQLEQQGIHIDPAPVFFPLLTAKLSPGEVEELKTRFVRPGFRTQIDTLEARAKELAGQITGRNAIAPSETWKVLFAAEPEVVLWLAYSSRSGAVQAKFKAFLNEWPQMRQRVPYALMQEMRITPDLPGYEKLLDDLFFALIDGKLDTPEATRAFLEPYSPPAPVVQASPRRRPAKAARSRSRKAVALAAASDSDTDAAETDTASQAEAEPEVAPAAPVPPVVRKGATAKVAPAKVAGKAAPGAPTAVKVVVVPSAEAKAAKPDPRKVKDTGNGTATPAKGAAKASPQTPAPVPAPKTNSKTSSKGTSPASRTEKAGAHPVIAKKATPATAKEAIPAKKAVPAVKTPAKKISAPVKGKPAAKKSIPAVKTKAKAAVVARKGPAAAMPKKQVAVVRKTSAPAKGAVVAKKTAKAAIKGRR